MAEITEEIISAVLRDNLSILQSAPVDYENALKKYAKSFYQNIKEKSTKITYGLQIGLTKKFAEFCLKNIIDSGQQPQSQKIGSILKSVLPASVEDTVSTAENNASVYIMYRSLKNTIDKEFEKVLELSK